MNSPALGGAHPHLDLDEQMYYVDQHRNKMHSEWVQAHSARTAMDHPNSRVKALLLVQEAARLEMIHLAHQRGHAKYVLSRAKKDQMNSSKKNIDEPEDIFSTSPSRKEQQKDQENASSSVSKKGLSASRRNQTNSSNITADSSAASPQRRSLSPNGCSSPSRCSNGENACSSASKVHKNGKKRSSSAPAPPQPVACGCLHVAGWRLMTPRYRVMALLKKHGEVGNLEAIVDALRQTYTSDAEMIEDMDSRYGPEPTTIDHDLLARSVDERIANHASRWAGIRESVDQEMQSAHPNSFQNVIRTLSVMRIFIEGSQGQTYGIDFSDRQRREAAQHAVLSKLRANRALFVNDCA